MRTGYSIVRQYDRQVACDHTKGKYYERDQNPDMSVLRRRRNDGNTSRILRRRILNARTERRLAERGALCDRLSRLRKRRSYVQLRSRKIVLQKGTQKFVEFIYRKRFEIYAGYLRYGMLAMRLAKQFI